MIKVTNLCEQQICVAGVSRPDYDISCGLNLLYNIKKYVNGQMRSVKLFIILAMKGFWSIIGAFDVIIGV
jgi:hypothetical protein